MKLTYDREVDVLYVRLNDAEIDDTIEEDDGTIIDYDAAGKIVGIEILDASKQIEYLSEGAVERELLPQPTTAA